MLNAEKYKRSVALHCPTCNGTQFQHEEPLGPVDPITCDTCKRAFTRDELIELNSENISERTKEIGKEIVEDMAKELKRSLSNNKYIKFR